ncbi:LysR family transcriptional regulator [Nocardioides insulae]|uniref:LysR family transcriptional regulator n=1 Tax=Nocardioides insulae TaxID=394734 RepID=UPI0003F55D90|nr:LysR family transcriptional regulator [Nocardioides insulae]
MQSPALTLDQLRCFIAVAEELHFGRAAERLTMTQPPLSRQIQKLERAVGAVLMERSNRGVTLTPAGAEFLDHAYRVTKVLEQGVEHARRVDAGMSGTIDLGFTAVSAIRLLGPLLIRLAEELPEVEVVLHEGVTGSQVNGIRRGELALGLARPPFDGSLIASRVVAREPLYAVLPVGHPLTAVSGALAPQDFDGTAMISYHPDQARYFHDLTVRFLVNGHARIVQRVQQILTAVLLASTGEGVALVPASATALGVEGVVYKPLHDVEGGHPDSDPARPVELHAIWARGGMTPLRRRVLRVVEEVSAGLSHAPTA